MGIYFAYYRYLSKSFVLRSYLHDHNLIIQAREFHASGAHGHLADHVPEAVEAELGAIHDTKPQLKAMVDPALEEQARPFPVIPKVAKVRAIRMRININTKMKINISSYIFVCFITISDYFMCRLHARNLGINMH